MRIIEGLAPQVSRGHGEGEQLQELIAVMHIQWSCFYSKSSDVQGKSRVRPY